MDDLHESWRIEADEWDQLQIVDKTIMEADLDRDGKISFEEFTKMVESTDVSMSMTLGEASHLLPSALLISNILIRPRNSCIPTTRAYAATSPRRLVKSVGAEFGRCLLML